MLSPSFETKEDAVAAGYVFIPAKVIEYPMYDGSNIGKIQRVDVTPGNSFGYNFSIGAFQNGQRIAKFGKSVEVWVENVERPSGGKGMLYTAVMEKAQYERAIKQARQSLYNLLKK